MIVTHKVFTAVSISGLRGIRLLQELEFKFYSQRLRVLESEIIILYSI